MMLNDKIDSLQAEIAKKQKELDRLERTRKAQENLPDNKKLAISMHEALCLHNHDEACGWFYCIDEDSNHDWSSHAHQRWLSKADAALEITDLDTIMELLKSKALSR